MLLAIVGKDVTSPGSWRHDFKVQLGLDLAGGTSVTEEAQTITGKPPSASDMTQARAIMIARVNGAGFSGAQVQQQGSNNMVVTVPGANTQKVVKLVGTTAQLLFRQVLLVGNANSTASHTTSPATSPTPSSSGTPTVSPSPGSKASSSPSTKASSSPQAAGAPGSAVQAGGRGLASGSRLLAAASPKPGKSSTPAASSSPSAPASTSPSPAPAPAASQPVGDTSLVSPATLKIFNKLDCADKQLAGSRSTTRPAIYDNPDSQIVTCNFNPAIGFTIRYQDRARQGQGTGQPGQRRAGHHGELADVAQ